MQLSTSTDRRSPRLVPLLVPRLLPLLAPVLVTALAAAGCGADSDRGSEPDVVVTVTSTPVPSPVSTVIPAPASPAAASPPPVEPAPVSGAPGVVDLAGLQLPAGTSVAVAPVGHPEQVAAAGTWTTGVAWSSIKVPLALAVLRAGNGAEGAAQAAITASDNSAAQQLWDSLGGGEQSARAVTDILREGGDQNSTVPSEKLRPEYTVFGQTTWSLDDQTRFASRLPCLPGAERVLDLMNQVIPSQHWGLGRIEGARFKGGWGPSPSGQYLVRQLGVVPAAGGDLAVTVATENGGFEQGTAALDEAVAALRPRLEGVVGGHC